MELISREAVLLEIQEAFGDSEENGLMYVIKNLPTFESRPKGKWRTSRVHGGIVKCDFCGFQWGSNEGRKFNFCPNCGADKRGEE